MIEDKTRLKTFLKKSVTEFLFHEIRNQNGQLLSYTAYMVLVLMIRIKSRLIPVGTCIIDRSHLTAYQRM